MLTTTTTLTKRYYPTLSEIMNVEDLPEFLSFAGEGLRSVFDKIHYKNLQFTKSYRGDAAFYSLDIVTKNIGLNLPGGLRFVLNPDAAGDEAISSFPVTLEYQWEILAFLRSFKLENFAFTPQAFYELGLKIFGVSEEQVLAHTLNFFVEPATNALTKFQQLINDINNRLFPEPRLILPVNEIPTISSVVTLIEQKLIDQHPNFGKSVSMILFAVYISDSNEDTVKARVQQFYNLMVPGGIEDYVKKLIIPKAKASLSLSAAIEFPTLMLKPVQADGKPVLDANGNPDLTKKTKFKFAEASLYVDTEAGIGYQAELGGSLIPEYSRIGNTGLIIQFNKAKLDLSRTTNIPEADAAGYPVDFTGLYIHEASLRFTSLGDEDPSKTSATIYAKEILIGTGGFSGIIGLEANKSLYRKFGTKFAAELNEFSITFKQGAIVSSSIKGTLTIPKFRKGNEPATVAIQANIFDNGDFNITASPQAEPYVITLPKVLELEVRSLSLGKRGEHYYVEIAGKLDFIAKIPGLDEVLPKGIEIKKLLIWDDGHFEFEGGSIMVPKSFRLEVGPVKLEVSNISLGGYTKSLNGFERKYHFFGFDGMINTGRAGVNATGNGIKYYFTIDDDGPDKSFDHFVRIDGIGIDITIPGNADKEKAAFLLNGYLSMKNPDHGTDQSGAATEYTGSVSFSLPKVKLSGSAGMRLQPGVPAFVVDIGLELATPIPIAGTGLGIYGFRGLIGQHYMPDKASTKPALPDTATWWEYYKAKDEHTGKEGITVNKFASIPGFSVGAGASIATTGDSGKVFSSKLFLLLGLPDVFLIQGQAAILRERIGLNDDADPPFSALIAFSDNSVRGNLGVNYNLPEKDAYKGFILSLQGSLDMAFFFNNASGWYLNVGKDNPESERVQAKVLTLFQGHAYLMLSMQGIKAGAGVRYDFKKSYGPVSVGIGAFLNIGGFISFKPVQVGGYIQLCGYAFLKVAWFSTSITISASLAVEAPHPFNIIGSLRIFVETPRLVPNIDVTVNLSWRKNDDKTPLRTPIPVLALPDPDKGYLPAIAVNILSNETFQLNYVTSEGSDIPAPDTDGWKYLFTKADPSVDPDVVIPLDCFIDIDLSKPVKPGSVPLGGANNQLAEGYQELLPPQRGVNAQAKHEFELTALTICAWEPNGSKWVAYNIYEAVSAIVLENQKNKINSPADAVDDLTTLKPGYWQFMEPNRFNKIRILSQHMFNFASGTNSSYTDLDARNFGRKDVFCFNNIIKRTIIDWKAEQENATYPSDIPFTFKAASFRFKDVTGSVKRDTDFNDNSLFINGNNGTLEIAFPEPLSEVALNFGASTNDIEIKFGQTTYTVDLFGQAIPETVYLPTKLIAKSEHPQVVTYITGSNTKAVDKVMLSFTLSQLPNTDYDGDLVIGGYFELPEIYPSLTVSEVESNAVISKALQFVTLYNQSFTTAELINKSYQSDAGVVAQWRLDTNFDRYNCYNGVVSGSPGTIPGFYEEGTEHVLQLHEVYSFPADTDALVIPFAPGLKVENGSFSFEATIIFNPYTPGVSTLLYKIKEDNGYKKGYTLHLCQNTPGINGATYANAGDIPEFAVWLTCYGGRSSSRIEITEKYTSNCATAQLADKQYKHIFISVNRSTNKIDAYIDSILKVSSDIPHELDAVVPLENFTYLNQLSYITAKQQIRLDDHHITEQHVIDEVRIMGDGLNKVVQPVWRPDTTYAIKLKTMDVITHEDYTDASEKTHIFGFRTVGPVGHFHQQNKKYIDLAKLDRADEFKLATLKHYIDYERSFPDAQSRYDLSKPVFREKPQIRLFFTKPYINAMFSTWETYLELPPVECSLNLQLIDPEGIIFIPELTWETLPEVEITKDNVDSFVNSLPEDLKIIYYLNQSASNDGCNAYPIPIKKRVKQGVYKFTDQLQPNTLYTALFKSVYKKEGVEQEAEVHKFSFKTSRYTSFLQQVKSFVLDETTGSEKYAIYSRAVSFTTDDINTRIKLLINDDTEDDPATVLQYAVQFDRLIYGGLLIKDLEPVDNTTITVIVNTDKSNNNARRIMGLLLRSPEPFNDPKLPALELNNSIKFQDPAGSFQEWIYIHSRDTSAVFITNSAMDVPTGAVQLIFNHITFNGTTYDTKTFTHPEIPRITLSLT